MSSNQFETAIDFEPFEWDPPLDVVPLTRGMTALARETPGVSTRRHVSVLERTILIA
jgi:hypothetical protein